MDARTLAAIDARMTGAVRSNTTPALLRDLRVITDLLRHPTVGIRATLEAERVALGGIPNRPDAQLPDCAAFAGTAQRCAECRTHKRLHA